jgi:hypothetical protein
MSARWPQVAGLAAFMAVATQFAAQAHSGNGELVYIHKVKEGQPVIFVANSSDEPVNTEISIRGAFALRRPKIAAWPRRDPVSAQRRHSASSPAAACF